MNNTPEQAAKLWCPASRVVHGTKEGAVASDQTAFNRMDVEKGKTTLPNGCTCISFYCSAWRWIPTGKGDVHGETYRPTTPTHGYCGLAGKS